MRSLVFGDEIQPEWTGQVCWRVNVPRPEDLDGIWMFVGTDGKAGIVPLAPDLAYVLLIEEPPARRRAGRRDRRLAATMRERLAEFGGRDRRDARRAHPARRGRRVPPGRWRCCCERPWYRDRVVLIGDAAHATSPHVGQGAAMAIEDALVLAEEVTADQPVDQALAAYMARREPRARFVFDTSRRIQELELAHDHGPENSELIVASMIRTAEPI